MIQTRSLAITLLVAGLVLTGCLGTQSFDNGEDEVRRGAEKGDAGAELEDAWEALSCDPLNLEGRPGRASFGIDRYARGVDDQELLLLVGVDALGQRGGPLRVFYGSDALKERVVVSTETEPGDRFRVRFSVDGGEAEARFGNGTVVAGQVGPQQVMYDPVSLEFFTATPLRIRLDQSEIAPKDLRDASFECLPGTVDTELSGGESSSCGEPLRFSYCIESEAASEGQNPVSLDTTLTVTAVGTGAAPDSNCPFWSRQQLGGGASSDDLVMFSKSSWIQGSDASGRVTTLSIMLDGARLPFDIGDELTLAGAFQLLAGSHPLDRFFTLRSAADGQLWLWWGEGADASKLQTPDEFTVSAAATTCSGSACFGTWDVHGLDVIIGGEASQVDPQSLTRVSGGRFVHTGDQAVTGPPEEGAQFSCPTDYFFGQMSAAYYVDALAIPDTHGIGGPCPYPGTSAPNGAPGDLVCLGGVATTKGYTTSACNANADCPGQSVCDGAYCRASCSNDEQCPPELACAAEGVDSDAEPFRYCQCDERCFESRCDVATCPDDCPAGDWVTYFDEDIVACIEEDSTCPAGFQRFDLAGCGCGCEPITVGECPAVPEQADFEYSPGGCNASCESDELRIETVCGCGCTPNPSCPRYHPLDGEGPEYLGARGECDALCEENYAARDDDCGCFCHWANNIVELCDAPLDAGPCIDFETRYFRNIYTGKCEVFEYGGCLGNWNNFRTLAACQEQCGG